MILKSSDISVVIQGPIDWSYFPANLKGMTLTLTESIRKFLPEAEIIISTWNGQKVDGLHADRIIFSKDPGVQGDLPGFVSNNVNRQIVSSLKGLSEVKRLFTLKMRSDMVLQGVDFLDHFSRVPDLPKKSDTVFRHAIVTNNFSSRNTASLHRKLYNHHLLFHPSDHVQFGYTEDVKRLWDIPHQTDADAYYFFTQTFPNRWRLAELSRFTPEQYILTNALRKAGQKIDIKHYADYSPLLHKISDHYMDTHFISIPDSQFPLSFPKYHTQHHMSFEWMRRNDGKPVKIVLPPPPQIPLYNRLTFPFRRPDIFKQRLKEGRYWRPAAVKSFFGSVAEEAARCRIPFLSKR